MTEFSAAIGTFSSCNKAGSIPLFTAHLETNPKDYLALMWRSRAYAITNQFEEAKGDVHRAISVSHGGDKIVAEAHLQQLLGNHAEFVEILRNTTKEYPNCSSAWSDLGGHYFYEENYTEATHLLSEAIKVAKENGETKAPWHSWDNYMLGEIFLEQNENARASACFKAAIESCPTLTVAHLGLCRTNIKEEQFTEAKQNFDTARNLNPTLVKETNFENFKAMLQSNDKRAPETNKSSRKSKKSSGAGGSSGKDGSSSSEDETSETDFAKAKKTKLDEIKKESPCIRKGYDGRMYIRRGDKWYSPDSAEHGGAAFKCYKNTKSMMEFMYSVDENLIPMTSKHESREGTSVMKKDTKIIKGND